MSKTLIDAGKIIGDSQTIILTTHAMPDGDGLGAEVALYHYLLRIKKEVRIVNPDAMPDRYQFLDPAKIVEVAGALKKPLQPVDLLVVVDTGDYRRLKSLWPDFVKNAKQILFLDHHPRLPDEHPPQPEEGKTGSAIIHDVIDERSSSIGELLYRMFNQSHDYLDPLNPSFRLAPEIALGLYVSILTDTNSFRYSRTTALSHRIAADLIDFGLQPEEIYQNIYSTKSAQHLKLIGETLASIQETSDGSIAWLEIPRSLRKKYGATGDDTQTIVNFLLLLKAAQILLLFREEDDGRIKVSIKSKGTLVVNAIAAEFGGGGHAFAAGFTATGVLSEIRDRLLVRLKDSGL